LDITFSVVLVVEGNRWTLPPYRSNSECFIAHLVMITLLNIAYM
jgi:hypothetical protein